jgi:hypothetical protein
MVPDPAVIGTHLQQTLLTSSLINMNVMFGFLGKRSKSIVRMNNNF